MQLTCNTALAPRSTRGGPSVAMSMHPARQAYVEEENGSDGAMEGIDYASVRE